MGRFRAFARFLKIERLINLGSCCSLRFFEPFSPLFSRPCACVFPVWYRIGAMRRFSVLLVLCVLWLSGCSQLPQLAPADSQKRWSIGVLSGSFPLHLKTPKNAPNPRLTWDAIANPPTQFVADPFRVKHNEKWLLFFELFNSSTGRGEIALAESHDLAHWRYVQVVLREQYHLSYPFVFKDGDSYYMIPETRAAHAVRLYKALSFPTSWAFERTLIEGEYVDSSPIKYHGHWWMFSGLSPYSLSIFHADSLHGPWREHPQSPMYVDDPSRARPAGRPILVAGKIVRFAQDNRGGYGKRVRAFIVDDISPTTFKEHALTPDPLLGPHGNGWTWSGMHHIDAMRLEDGSWVAAVDGNGNGRLNPSDDE